MAPDNQTEVRRSNWDRQLRQIFTYENLGQHTLTHKPQLIWRTHTCTQPLHSLIPYTTLKYEVNPFPTNYPPFTYMPYTYTSPPFILPVPVMD